MIKERLGNGDRIPIILYELNPLRDPNYRINHYRNDFNGQIFFQDERGRYAIRCTSAIMSAWFAGAYWCVVDANKDGKPDIDYSVERKFIWYIERTSDRAATD